MFLDSQLCKLVEMPFTRNTSITAIHHSFQYVYIYKKDTKISEGAFLRFSATALARILHSWAPLAFLTSLNESITRAE